MRYFLNIRDNDRFIVDPEGVTAESLEAVHTAAAAAARELHLEGLIADARSEALRFEIADQTGTVWAEVPVRDFLGEID